MTNRAIEIILILLLIFTPLALGSQVLWAFSLMELGIILIIILWVLGELGYRPSATRPLTSDKFEIPPNPQSQIRNPKPILPLTIALLSLCLAFVLLQMIPLPEGIVKLISPKTYELRNQLTVIVYPQSSILKPQSQFITLSLFPLGTKIEFLKWLALVGLFIFLLRWKLPDNGRRLAIHLIITLFLVGVFESVYGIFEFFSGRHHILTMDFSSLILSVQGTFANRNYFAGYLLMVIPLSMGFFFASQANQPWQLGNWRHRLTSFDGKSTLLGFGVILMILGLLLSASRAGVLCLLIAFTMIRLLFRRTGPAQRVSRLPALTFVLGALWAAWIGLDALINRFFTVSESLGERWVMWIGTLEILKDFPLFGSGLGTFTEVFPMYRFFHARGLFTHAENDFLQLASEIGLLGAAPIAVLFFFLFFKATSGIRSLSSEEPARYIGIGGLVGILALMFHSMVERNLQVPANAFLYTVIWAMVLRVAADSGTWVKGDLAASRDDGRRRNT
jgi:O-antigen ligase